MTEFWCQVLNLCLKINIKLVYSFLAKPKRVFCFVLVQPVKWFSSTLDTSVEENEHFNRNSIKTMGRFLRANKSVLFTLCKFLSMDSALSIKI